MDKLPSRKEKRKAARNEKKQHKHQALLHFQKSRKLKQNKDDSRKMGLGNSGIKEKDISLSESESDRDVWTQESTMMKGHHIKNMGNRDARNNDTKEIEMSLTESSDEDGMMAEPAVVHKMPRKNDKKVSRKKTKFEEYLEVEMNKGASMEEDLEMQRRLAKKLKVKNGKLKDDDDGLNSLFEGIPSILDSLGQGYDDNSHSESENVESADDKKSKKRKKKSKISEPEFESDNDATDSEQESEDMSFELGEEGEENTTSEEDSEAENIESIGDEDSKMRKRKRKKSQRKNGSDDDASSEGQSKSISSESGEEDEANTTIKRDSVGVQGSGKYVAPHLRARSGDNSQEYLQIRRRVRGLLNRLSESNVESVTKEIFTIFQSVSRAVASQMISEEVLASCSGGPRGNEQYAAVFAAFVAGMACMVGIDFGARLMASLAKSFEDEYLKEDNLSLRNLSLLLCYLCIFGVCSSDLIYDFLLKLSKRLTEIDVSTILTVLQCCGMKLRSDDPASMKDFILSVRSRVNELKASPEDVETKAHGKRMEFMLETICDIKNNKKRAKDDSPQHTRIKNWLQKLRAENITITGVKWSKLLDPSKKGQWWFSVDDASAAEDVDKVAKKIDRESNEAQKMLQLASKLRMNTDTRRAIFCVIMSGEDYLDAFEKLLRLSLQGKQDREIMRVLVECCLQEKVFNKYYTALASKLCSHDKNHKFTLQYCLWDQFKEVESMPLLRSMHLAKFVAEMLACFNLSLAVLKVVDLIDATQLTAKRIMHFRMLFEAVFEYPDDVVWNMFTRVAVAPELEELRNGMEFFIREYVLTANKAASKKFKLAKKALSNAEGVLM